MRTAQNFLSPFPQKVRKAPDIIPTYTLQPIYIGEKWNLKSFIFLCSSGISNACLFFYILYLKGHMMLFKDHYFVYWCNRICWYALMFKKHIIFSNVVYYCRSYLPHLSQTLRFLQSPSFQQVQSALIGQLTQCIVIGRTPQARVRNVTPPYHNRELKLSS